MSVIFMRGNDADVEAAVNVEDLVHSSDPRSAAAEVTAIDQRHSEQSENANSSTLHSALECVAPWVRWVAKVLKFIVTFNAYLVSN